MRTGDTQANLDRPLEQVIMEREKNDLQNGKRAAISGAESKVQISKE